MRTNAARSSGNSPRATLGHINFRGATDFMEAETRRSIASRLSPWLLCLVAFSPVLTGAEPADATRDPVQRAQSFWLAVARDCEVPPGETAFGLVSEAVGKLGSPDPVWRDDIGYGVVVSCVYRKELLSGEERRALVQRLSGNLESGIGQTNDDSVLLRSFSALDLSVLAAMELQAPVLSDADYRQLLNDALRYLDDERDLRGFEPRVGWIHATAHTADLLKFLARDPRFGPADQGRLLEAVWLRMTSAEVPVFTHAEDERLAAAVLSVIRRTDFDAALLGPWLGKFVQLEKDTWAVTPPRVDALAASQNARNLLRSLYALLSMPEPEPAGGQLAAREAVLGALQRIRR